MKNWALFGLLGLIWGSSFLLIKIAVAPDGAIPNQVGLFDPLTLVAFRLGLGALGLLALVVLLKRKLPSDRRTWVLLATAGLINNAIPFALITWGERTIDSGLASVLDATVPLFSIVIAHFALADEQISMNKIFGLIVGFAGVILLATRSLDPTHPNPLAGQLAVIGASFFYGLAAVFMRRTLRHVESISTAAFTVTFGALFIILLTVLTVRPLPLLMAIQPGAWLAILGLGIVNTFIAYTIYFTLLTTWGTRVTFVTYVTPPISVILGAVFNHEPVDWKLILGTVLILSGVVAANVRLRRSKPTPVALSPMLDGTTGEAG